MQEYARLKAAHLTEVGYVVPEIYRSSFVNLGGSAEVQFIYRQFLMDLPKSAKILVVGVMGGRDYFLLKNLGYEVVAVDLGPQPEIDPIIYCNIEERLPFKDDTFDAVLIGEVLEHLREDVRALDNIRRVLKPAGRLVVSLPFYQDAEEGHVRIHSPKSGERLLMMGGFAVKDYLERPGVVWFRSLNIVHHGLSLFIYRLTGRTSYRWVNEIAGNIEWKLGHLAWLRPVRKWSNCFGGYYLCAKAEHYDHVALNKRLYTSQP